MKKPYIKTMHYRIKVRDSQVGYFSLAQNHAAGTSIALYTSNTRRVLTRDSSLCLSKISQKAVQS